MLAERPALPRVVLFTFVACAIAAWRFAPPRTVFVVGDDGGFEDLEGIVWPLSSPWATSSAGPAGPQHWGLSNCHDQQSAGVVAIATCDTRSGSHLFARIRNGDETHWKMLGSSASTEVSEIVTLRTKVGDVHAMKVTQRLLANGRDVVWDYEFLFGVGPSRQMSVYEPILSGRIAGERPMVSYRIEITEDGVVTITGSRISPEGTRSDDRSSGPLAFP